MKYINILIYVLFAISQNILAGSPEEVNIYDYLIFQKDKSSDVENFLNQKYLVLDAIENGYWSGESLSINSIEKEILFDQYYISTLDQFVSLDDEYIENILSNRNIEIEVFFLMTRDSSMAEEIAKKLSKYNNDSTELSEIIYSEYLSKSDYYYSISASLTWENLMDNIREEIFSMEDYNVGKVVRFPTTYILPVRLSSRSIEIIDIDTMPEEWFDFLRSTREKEERVNDILRRLNEADISYIQSTMEFLVEVDSAKFAESIIPNFPNISPVDSQRILVRYSDKEITLGEMLVRLRRKGLFPKLGDTTYLRLVIENELIYQDLIVNENIEFLSNPWTLAKIRFLQDEYIYTKYLKIITDTIYVDINEMRAFYERNIENYYTPDEYRYRIVLIADSFLADSVRLLVSEGYDMDSLARLFSDHPTASSGGDAGWRSKSAAGTLQPVMKDLEIGVVSELFRTIDGWAFIKLEEFSSSRPIPFDSLHIRVKNETRKEKVEFCLFEFFQSLREKYYLKPSLRDINPFFWKLIIFKG